MILYNSEIRRITLVHSASIVIDQFSLVETWNCHRLAQMQLQGSPTAKFGGITVIDKLKLGVAIFSNLNIAPHFKFSITPPPVLPLAIPAPTGMGIDAPAWAIWYPKPCQAWTMSSDWRSIRRLQCISGVGCFTSTNTAPYVLSTYQVHLNRRSCNCNALRCCRSS